MKKKLLISTKLAEVETVQQWELIQLTKFPTLTRSEVHYHAPLQSTWCFSVNGKKVFNSGFDAGIVC